MSTTGSENVALENYDPNLRWAYHVVELTFQQWGYTATCVVTIRGNCKGWDILQSALDSAAESMWKADESVHLLMRRPAADGGEDETLECEWWEDEEGDEIEEWLGAMLVGLRIVEQVEEVRPRQHGIDQPGAQA